MYRMHIFSATHNHASSPTTLAASSPQVHTSPTTAPRASLSRSPPPPHQTVCLRPGQARVWNEWKPSPSFSCMFTSPLLLSLSVSFLSLVPLVISFLVFYPLSCSLYWSTYRHSSTLMIKLEAIIDSIRCCRVWQWEGEGEGKVRRLRRKGDTQVTFYFSFVLSYTDCMGWSDTPTWYHKASEGRRACGGWYTSWEYLF